MKTWKYHLTTVALILMLLVGLVFVFINPIESFLIKRVSNQTLQVSAEQIEENINKDVTYDFEDIQSLTITDVLRAQAEAKNVPVIGNISIPSVDMQLPIIKGVSEMALSIGAGTMKAEQKMGEGNYALASHYIRNKTNILFGPLYNASVNDLVYVTDLTDVYIYKIRAINVIEADAVSVIYDKHVQVELTLITCAEKGTKRLAVLADFVEKMPLEDLDEDVF